MSDQNDLMTVRDVARTCNRSEETVRRWIWSGKLRARKLGNQMFISKDDLAAMQAPRAGEAKATYRARPGKRGSGRMDKATREILERLMQRRDELAARYGAADVDKLLKSVREGTAFYTVGPRTKAGKLAHLERAVALGKELRAKYGSVNVSDLIHEIREDDD